MEKSKRNRSKPEIVNSAEKEQYLIEAAAFASCVAEELNDPDAVKIYCPAFKVKPCGCVQRFITGGDVSNFPSEGSLRRAADLLRLHKEAQRLKSKISTDRNDKGDKRVLRMLRAEGFERFILVKRLVVRQEMGICERACQRLLFYSNNFLHKDLKTGPEKGPRIKRFGARKISRQTLKPISELAREICCPDKCVRIALTHNKILESWRKTAQSGQQGVRKVVQEILSSKQSNCHKFITMVTGCSFSTIYKVKEQLKRKGKNNSQEQSSKIWWQEDSKSNTKTIDYIDESNVTSQSNIELVPDSKAMCNGTTSHHEISILNGSHDGLHQRTDIDMHSQESPFQMEPILSQFIQTISAVNPSQVVSVPAASSTESPPQSHTLTVLGPASTSSANYMSSHLQFMDNTHSPVIISVPEPLQGQAISVFTSSGTFEPLTSNPFGNVVMLPDPTAIFMNGSQMTGI